MTKDRSVDEYTSDNDKNEKMVAQKIIAKNGLDTKEKVQDFLEKKFPGEVTTETVEKITKHLPKY